MSKSHPKWKYHKTQEARIVQTAADEAALGPDWKDTPAAFIEVAPVVAPTITDAQAAEIYGKRAADLVAHVAVAPKEALDELASVRATEVGNPKYPGGRKQVLAAIDARIAALTVVPA